MAGIDETVKATGWIDSHCHLDFDEFSGQDMVYLLKVAGCEGILVPAISAQYFQRLCDFKLAADNKEPNFVNIALGLHPFFLHEHQPEHLLQLESFIIQYQPCAMGEIGLDYALPNDTFETQLWWFTEQVKLAQKYSLPLVIHCRKAHDQLASILRRIGFSHGGFIHGFSGSQVQADAYLKLGFVLGLGGALTYERAKALHKLTAYLPDNAYVLETDSPDMRPSFARGEVNTPLNIPRIVQYIAELRGQTPATIIQNSSKNYHMVMCNSATPS